MVMMRVTLNACSDADQPLSPDEVVMMMGSQTAFWFLLLKIGW